jgi:predicted acylesterase/phospholipase RssA
MASSSRKGRLGLALASGGLMGGIYEVGALRALEESIQGLDLNQLHVYVGVSAGAFVGSHLVNGITVTDMVRALHDDPGSGTSFDTSIFFHPALQELRRRGLQVPWVIADLLKQFLNGKEPSSLLGRIGGLGPSLPVCFFDNEAIRAHLHKLFSMRGRTDDFRKLSRRFFVVATDLETGEAVLFGKGGLDHVPISRAVQASSAVPGLYQPVEVEGRVCVDGVLLKTLHSTVALGQGADLLLCVNPLVPINTGTDDARATLGPRAVQRGGLPAVLSQCFRILIHSRVVLGVERSHQTYPKADLVLFEPKATEHRLFTNLFRVHSRHKVCEIGYEQTRMDLWNRRETLGPVFAKYGLLLRADILADPTRSVWDCLEGGKPVEAGVAARLDAALRQLEG